MKTHSYTIYQIKKKTQIETQQHALNPLILLYS